MSKEPTHDGDDADEDFDASDELDAVDEFMEIEWDVLEAAIDAMAEAGLDLSDHQTASEHVAVLLASLLRRVRTEDPDADEERLSEMAAEVAAIAVELAAGDDEVPPFEVSEDSDDDED